MSFEWAAGLFEGEGCIRTYSPNSRTYEVAIKMTDLDILERVQEIFGGTIKQQPQTAPHHKPIWRWYISNKRGVQQFLLSILPYLGYRRTYKAQNLLDAIDGV